MISRRDRLRGVGALAVVLALTAGARAQGPTAPAGSVVRMVPVPPVRTPDDLARLTTEQLDALYAQAPPAGMPWGRIKGRPLVLTGSALAVPVSRAGRLLWQGKVFDPATTTAVNRFVGVRIIRGQLYQGASWFDGRPALILDYAETSRLYRPYRDEIREVAPGLYLGRMYDRRGPVPKQVLLFALGKGAR